MRTEKTLKLRGEPSHTGKRTSFGGPCFTLPNPFIRKLAFAFGLS